MFKPQEIDRKRAENIKTILKCEGMTQKKLAEMIYMSPENLNRIIKLRHPLTEATAETICLYFPKFRKEWLLGYDCYMTKEDFIKGYVKRSDATNNACLQVLDSALREVCAREGIEIPKLDNAPEILLLEGQLRDFADSLMWNYVKHREHSHFWGTLDQGLEAIERNIKK